MSIQPYIDRGWYTIPLKKEIINDYNCFFSEDRVTKETVEKYSNSFNKKDSDFGAVITGEISNIFVLECLNDKTLDFFKALDKKKNDFLVKYESGGAIVFKYSLSSPDSKEFRHCAINYRILNNGSIFYLPTEKNKTQSSCWSIIPEPKKIGQQSLFFIENSINKEQLVKDSYKTTLLYPIIQKVLTKKLSFSNASKMLSKQKIIINKTDEDSKSYLNRISKILRNDSSIDSLSFCDFLMFFNSKLEYPLSEEDLNKNYIQHVLTENRDSQVIDDWTFDKDVQNIKTFFFTKDSDAITSFYDSSQASHFAYEVGTQHLIKFKRLDDLRNHLTMCTGSETQKKSITDLPICKVISSPKISFGFLSNNSELVFNKFKRSDELEILSSVGVVPAYKYPHNTMAFLEGLVPNKKKLTYLLRFLRTKLTTFKYSSVILCFVGVPGSGKNVFVSLLKDLVGQVSSITIKMFLEKHNDWIVDNLFVHLDEVTEGITTVRDKSSLFGLLKGYSGSNTVGLRRMHAPVVNVEHHTTFILTANKNPFPLQKEDRRIALFECPQRLIDNEEVKKTNDISAFVRSIKKETKDFACFLSQAYSNLPSTEYFNPIQTTDSPQLKHLPTKEKVLLLLNSEHTDMLIAELQAYNILRDADCIKNGFITMVSAKRLYERMLDHTTESFELIDDYIIENRRTEKINIKGTSNIIIYLK